MKKLFEKYKKAIIFLVAVVVLFSLYNFFLAGEGDDGPLLTSEGLDGSSLAGREILTFLLEIRSIELDQDFFNSKSFNTLIDFSQEIEPQPVGRPNPFAPVGVDIEFSPTEELGLDDLDNLDDLDLDLGNF